MKKRALIAGAVLAAWRRRWPLRVPGGDVRMYERVAEFSEVGAGVQLGPNVVRCLSLGLAKSPAAGGSVS